MTRWNDHETKAPACGQGFRAASSVGWMGGATDGPRIGSTEQLAKGSIWRSRDSHRRLPPEVSGLQHFYRLVSPATFPPTECLMTPVSYSPRAVLRASDVRTRPRSPSRCLLGGLGSCFDVRSHPQQWDRCRNSRWPQRGWGGEMRGANDGRAGESASTTWGNKRLC